MPSLELSRMAFSQKKVTFFPENRFSRAQIILQLPLKDLEGTHYQSSMLFMFLCSFSLKQEIQLTRAPGGTFSVSLILNVFSFGQDTIDVITILII